VRPHGEVQDTDGTWSLGRPQMNLLTQHWSFDPFLLVLLLVAAVHFRGLRRMLTAVRRAGRPTRPWLGQALLFWSSLLVVALAVMSPIDYWSDHYLRAHVVQHILLTFIAPPLLVIGAPWIPLLGGLPRSVRGGFGRLAQRTKAGREGSGDASALARVRHVLSRPMTSVVLFNATMIIWHLPGPFDLAARNQFVHIWLEHGSFFGFGVVLWLQMFGSRPLRPLLRAPLRVVSLIGSNAVMVAVAATLVMFTKDAYPWYAIGHTAAQQAADQQLGGAILWVCGEVIFLPAILYLVSQWLTEDVDLRPPTYLQRTNNVV
jgi:putative membrane protein